MEISRTNKAKLNIVTSLFSQCITLICGLIVPRMMLAAFGSEVNGAVSSITQFLGYITVLEAGIGGVTRSALYKSLATGDTMSTAKILNEVKHFFRIIGSLFFIYVVILAISFKSISGVKCFDRLSTAVLVVILSLSSFAQYFIGITNLTLLQASQQSFITTGVNISATILNTVFTVALIHFGSTIHIVKLVSSIVFVMKPLILWAVVRKKFNLPKIKERDKNSLNQKWAGLGQHIAYVIHNKTDMTVLTVFDSLVSVSVYSVYNMIVSSIQNLTTSISTGMEAVFGDMLAKKETDKLHKTFGYYETLVSLISVTLFSVTAVLITPFIKIYTAGITDADYNQPVLGELLIIASLLYCLRSPYIRLIAAAGHYKQTQKVAYTEAGINIVTSVILVWGFGVIGVAAGTVFAMLYRYIYSVYYIFKKILFRTPLLALKRFAVNIVCYISVLLSGNALMKFITVTDYKSWAVAGVVITIISAVISFLLNIIFYGSDIRVIFKKTLGVR